MNVPIPSSKMMKKNFFSLIFDEKIFFSLIFKNDEKKFLFSLSDFPISDEGKNDYKRKCFIFMELAR